MTPDRPTPPQTDTPSLPWLGRKLLWLDNPKTIDRLVFALFAVCTALFAADFLYHKHTYVEAENIPGFYALYGFVLCAGLVFGARLLRVLVKRPEDYYAPRDIETEDYPAEGLGKEAGHD